MLLFRSFSLCTLCTPCRIPGPAPSGCPLPPKHQAWLLEVLADRVIDGVQHFKVNWQGESAHQWVPGRELECNDALEEYARKSGNPLDWSMLEGEPVALRLVGPANVNKRKGLDWERSGTAGSAPKRNTKILPAERKRTRPETPRRCKYS